MSESDLHARLLRHESERALEDAVDARLEEALRDRQPLERVLPDLLALLAAHTRARGAAISTLDEALELRCFTYGATPLPTGWIEAAERGEARLAAEDALHVLHALDVAGEPFGHIVLTFDGEPAPEAAGLLSRFAERLDNHLAAVAEARRRFEVVRAISEALKEPVLDHGIARAIEILRETVQFDDLVLLFRHEDDVNAGALRYTIFAEGLPVYDSRTRSDPEVDAFLRTHARDFLEGNDAAVRARFGIHRYREEVLITGVRAARVVGRLLVTSRQGEFHTYDRELLDRFADYLRARIVDFNREWKLLANVFSREACERLLREEGYRERYLTPRDREVAILYADIAGFTRVSEQVLRHPEAIGRLIDTWAEGAVRILWETGGVFDKLIGDCIIGFWGPPFFEMSPREATSRALEAAERLSLHTQALTQDPLLPELAGLAPLDVAVGLHYAPTSVGFFGPNDAFTGFSSGMNNAARLQGVARGGQILAMQAFVDALDEPDRCGEAQEATVKNVAEPLAYRAIKEKGA